MDMQELYTRFCATELGYKASYDYFNDWLNGLFDQFYNDGFDFRYMTDEDAYGQTCGAFNAQELIFAINNAEFTDEDDA